MPWTLRIALTAALVAGLAEATFRVACDIGPATTRLARRHARH